METFILKSMTDFVLEQTKHKYYDKEWKLDLIKKYAELLKQPLTLGMFVPCDEDGNVLIEPNGWLDGDCTTNECDYPCKCNQYKKAVERVLFERFKIKKERGIKWVCTIGYELEFSLISKLKIEDIMGEGIELTETAKKKIGI